MALVVPVVLWSPPPKLGAWKRWSGEATNSPACTVAGSPATCTVPTVVHRRPSADSCPVSVSPERVSRSHRGEVTDTGPAWPAMSWVKSYCIRTPCPGVAMIAAYGDPGLVLALIRIPALAHGWVREDCGSVVGRCKAGPVPRSEEIAAVRLPFPASG